MKSSIITLSIALLIPLAAIAISQEARFNYEQSSVRYPLQMSKSDEIKTKIENIEEETAREPASINNADIQKYKHYYPTNMKQ